MNFLTSPVDRPPPTLNCDVEIRRDIVVRRQCEIFPRKVSLQMFIRGKRGPQKVEHWQIMLLSYHFSFQSVIEPLQQWNHCALAATAGPHQSDFLAWLDGEGEPAKHLDVLTSWVAETHAAKLNTALHGGLKTVQSPHMSLSSVTQTRERSIPRNAKEWINKYINPK